jgi:exodeoxyribonuclease-3
MKLVTWNVNSLKARLPRVLEFLEQHKPDVLAMQETKTESDTFPHDELAEAGYRAVDHSAGRWAGVAIAAREGLDLTEQTAGLAGEPAVDEARWIEATVDGLRVASVYVPNGRAIDSEPFHQKLAFLEAMGDRAAELTAAGPTAIVGDMNVCRTDLDVYDPEAFIGDTHVTVDERSRFERLLDHGGLVDAYRELESEEPGYTWWDYRAGHFHKKMGLRIDYVLLSPSLAEGLRRCGIDRNYRKGPKPSDHAPLIAELDTPG